MKNYFQLVLKGFCMGAADVVPGVSGGTMALVLGIYKELIGSIKSFDMVFLKKLLGLNIKDAFQYTSTSWRFLFAVGVGILTAIFSLAKILSWLLQNQPEFVWSFFFGLILASIIIVSHNIEKWSLPTVMFIIFGGVCSYLLIGIVPAQTPEAPWFLFVCGFIAICAMILPGISGSFILVLLGKYYYVLEAVNNKDITVLLFVGAGAITGLITFVRLLNWLLSKFYNSTIALLTGLMVGSLRKIWPWKEHLSKSVELQGKTIIVAVQNNVLPLHWLNREVMISFLLILTGFIVVILLNYFGNKKERKLS